MLVFYRLTPKKGVVCSVFGAVTELQFKQPPPIRLIKWARYAKLSAWLLCALLCACETPAQLTQKPLITRSQTSGSTQQLHSELNDWQRTRSSGNGAQQTPQEAVNSVLQKPSLHSNAPFDCCSDTVSPTVRKTTEQDARHQTLANKLSVNLSDASIGSVLQILASQSQLQLQFHETLEQRISITVEDKPLSTVLGMLAQQVDMHWELNGSVLHVWGNSPYSKSYAVNYLNLDRSTRSRVGLATQVGTINANENGGGAGSGVSNSSQTQLDNSADHLFWNSLVHDLDGIVTPEARLAGRFTVNRDAGLVTLFATASVHQSVQKYLAKIHDSAQRQVLIEATVVEVTLSDSFEAGVDWQRLASGINGVSAAQVFNGNAPVNADTVGRITTPGGLFSLVQQSASSTLSATLNLLQEFGDIRILSKPRIIALNNQSSVLKVVDNRVYFTVNVERQRSETKDEVITETQIHTVPVGLVMNVTPFISADGDVMLNVRPTLSRIIGFVNDPNPELALANVRNSVPEIQVREMESMLRVRSGDMAIIGGLMQDSNEQASSNLPGLHSVPLLGSLFNQKKRSRRQTELLIVLRPTVMSDPKPAASLHLQE